MGIKSKVDTIFQPAGQEDLDQRAVVNAKMELETHLATASGRKPCDVCRRAMRKGERFLSLGYSTRWGRAFKAICKHCIKAAAEIM